MANNILKNLAEKISDTRKEDIQLYFITRKRNKTSIKSGFSDRYKYSISKVTIDDEIREYIYKTTLQEINSLNDKDYPIRDYDPFAEDPECVLTYKITDGISSFYDLVTHKVHEELPFVISLKKIIIDETLLAYCVGFNITENNESIYTFKKIQKSKIAIDKNSDKNFILTIFDTTNKKLTLMNRESISLDMRIDCLYYKNLFYILKKGAFEQIVGLQEEYKVAAKEIVSEINSTGNIVGLATVAKDIGEKVSIHRKLVKLKNNGGIEVLKNGNIKLMSDICAKYGYKINLDENNHIVVKNTDDLDLVLKLLCDYYKIGEVSGKSYGTYSGQQIK